MTFSPLFDAANLSLDQAPAVGPSARSILAGWAQPLNLGRVTKTTVNFRTVEVVTPIPGDGVWQPLSFEQLSIKPEGERSWRWFMVHALSDLELATDDRISRKGETYVVMAKGDYFDQGTYEYHVVNAFDKDGGGK